MSYSNSFSNGILKPGSTKESRADNALSVIEFEVPLLQAKIYCCENKLILVKSISLYRVIISFVIILLNA
jgi:hypothetical protein